MDTLQNMIDQGGRMRLNVNPFPQRINDCNGLVIHLPQKKNGNSFSGPYDEVRITSINRYTSYGAICGQEVSEWLNRNGFARKAGAPISLFSFKLEKKDEVHHIYVEKFLGTRMPHQRMEVI